MVKLTGLWKRQGKDGETFLTGNVGMGRFMILPNKYKRNEKDPDYHLLVAENVKEKKEPQKKQPGDL